MENIEPVETLESILNEPVEEPIVESKTESVPASDSTPDELVWEDDESPAEEDLAPDEVESAPEDADDEELARIEEKNKWMKERLAPTKQKLSKAEEEIAKLRSELESFKASKPAETAPRASQPAPASIDEFIDTVPQMVEINTKLAELKALADKGEITEGDYVDQRTELLTDKKVLKREISNSIQYQQRIIQESEAKVAKDFESTVLAKKDIYPNIDKALSRVDKNAEHLNIDIRRALIMDDETNGINKLAPDLVNIIGNDKQALGYLIAQSKLAAKTGRTPVAALEYIGRLKARIQSESAESIKAPDEIVPAKKATGLPKVLRHTTNAEPLDLNKWADEAIKTGIRPW